MLKLTGFSRCVCTMDCIKRSAKSLLQRHTTYVYGDVMRRAVRHITHYTDGPEDNNFHDPIVLCLRPGFTKKWHIIYSTQ